NICPVIRQSVAVHVSRNDRRVGNPGLNAPERRGAKMMRQRHAGANDQTMAHIVVAPAFTEQAGRAKGRTGISTLSSADVAQRIISAEHGRVKYRFKRDGQLSREGMKVGKALQYISKLGSPPRSGWRHTSSSRINARRRHKNGPIVFLRERKCGHRVEIEIPEVCLINVVGEYGVSRIVNCTAGAAPLQIAAPAPWCCI